MSRLDSVILHKENNFGMFIFMYPLNYHGKTVSRAVHAGHIYEVPR